MFSAALVSFLAFAVTAQAGKRCLAWPWFNEPLDPTVFNNGGGEVVVIYDWETYLPPSKNGTGGLGFCGTQRCLDCNSSPINELYARWEEQKWEMLFTLNEPEYQDPVVSPTEAASWFIEHINPLPIKKVLPAVSSSAAPNEGLGWLSQMITACAGKCNFDHINVHWYGATFAEFQNYIEGVHQQFPQYEFIVSEFALANPPGGQVDQVAFFQQAFSFLDTAPYVSLYCPFVATSPALMNPTNSPNIDTSSCLYDNDGKPSAVGDLMF